MPIHPFFASSGFVVAPRPATPTPSTAPTPPGSTLFDLALTVSDSTGIDSESRHVTIVVHGSP